MSSYAWSKEKQKMVRVKKKRELDKLEGTEEGKELTDDLLREYIKNAYFRVNELNIKQLSKELPLPRRDRDVSVDVYLKFMEDYLNRLKNGRLPDKSYFVAAPDGFGKKVFVYQAIKDALMYGMEPTPLLASHDLYALLNKKEYEEFYKNFEGADMAFLTLGGAPTKTDLIVVKTVLEYCERMGMPLLVISRFEPEIFYKSDVVTSQYLGIKVARRGDFGVLELAGFNRGNMMQIKDEIRKKADIEDVRFNQYKKE